MKPYCPKCTKKVRVIYKRKKISKKDYWIAICIECKTPLEIDALEK